MPGCDVACGYGSKIGENLERRHLQETTIKATWEVSRSALALRCPVLTQVLTLSGQEASCTDDAAALSGADMACLLLAGSAASVNPLPPFSRGVLQCRLCLFWNAGSNTPIVLCIRYAMSGIEASGNNIRPLPTLSTSFLTTYDTPALPFYGMSGTDAGYHGPRSRDTRTVPLLPLTWTAPAIRLWTPYASTYIVPSGYACPRRCPVLTWRVYSHRFQRTATPVVQHNPMVATPYRATHSLGGDRTGKPTWIEPFLWLPGTLPLPPTHSIGSVQYQPMTLHCKLARWRPRTDIGQHALCARRCPVAT
eukprot:3941979-Rhodomonas_salina.2